MKIELKSPHGNILFTVEAENFKQALYEKK
jgi:hypothetical protein